MPISFVLHLCWNRPLQKRTSQQNKSEIVRWILFDRFLIYYNRPSITNNYNESHIKSLNLYKNYCPIKSYAMSNGQQYQKLSLPLGVVNSKYHKKIHINLWVVINLIKIAVYSKKKKIPTSKKQLSQIKSFKSFQLFHWF